MSVPLHSKFRRKVRTLLNRILSVKKQPMHSLHRLTHDEVMQLRKVLVVRVNYRIGNILFLTPMLNTLKQAYPHLSIDLLVGNQAMVGLMQPSSAINRVFAAPRALLKQPLKLRRFYQQVNANDYDLVINPEANSGIGHLLTRLIHARFKLGFFHPDYWCSCDLTVLDQFADQHAALKPLELLPLLSIEPSQYQRTLSLNLTEQERERGLSVMKSQLKSEQTRVKIALFRDARGDKKLPQQWWMELVNQLAEQSKDIDIIDIQAPNLPQLGIQQGHAMGFSNLRDLACFISAMDVFVSADTGPMHLASASGCRLISLFNVTSAQKYGPLGEQDNVLYSHELTPSQAADFIIHSCQTLLREGKQ